MPNPVLMFCPYLSLNTAIKVGNWEVGPFSSFNNRWQSPDFQRRATQFVSKFADPSGETLKNATLIAPAGRQIDGVLPTPEEYEALELSIGFSCVDNNPRHTAKGRGMAAWQVATSDNPELFVWPIDIASGWVTTSSGVMVRSMNGGFTLDDEELVIRPPVELHMGLGDHHLDAETLNTTYATVLASRTAPVPIARANRVLIAIRWLLKAWRNSESVRFEDRLIFLKTGFEAIAGTSDSFAAGQHIRAAFEALKETTATDTAQLVWSPSEAARHTHTFKKNGKTQTASITDLQHWFVAFSLARNAVIHDGVIPSFDYTTPNSNYAGHLVFTGEFVLRALIKVELSALGFGHPFLWKDPTWRAVWDAWP